MWVECPSGLHLPGFGDITVLSQTENSFKVKDGLTKLAEKSKESTLLIRFSTTFPFQVGWKYINWVSGY